MRSSLLRSLGWADQTKALLFTVPNDLHVVISLAQLLSLETTEEVSAAASAIFAPAQSGQSVRSGRGRKRVKASSDSVLPLAQELQALQLVAGWLRHALANAKTASTTLDCCEEKDPLARTLSDAVRGVVAGEVFVFEETVMELYTWHQTPRCSSG